MGRGESLWLELQCWWPPGHGEQPPWQVQVTLALCVCLCVCENRQQQLLCFLQQPRRNKQGKKGLGLRKKPKFSGNCCLQSFLGGLPRSRKHSCVSPVLQAWLKSSRGVKQRAV